MEDHNPNVGICLVHHLISIQCFLLSIHDVCIQFNQSHSEVDIEFQDRHYIP